MTSSRKLNIFIAEDNLFYQQLIAKQLEPIASAIHFFTTGEDCVAALRDLVPDLIVLDNNLEGSLSGLETVKLIRICMPEVYVILFSSEQALNSQQNILLYGDFDYVEKNVNAFSCLKDKIALKHPLFKKV